MLWVVAVRRGSKAPMVLAKLARVLDALGHVGKQALRSGSIDVAELAAQFQVLHSQAGGMVFSIVFSIVSGSVR